jgi:hypothetical protein
MIKVDSLLYKIDQRLNKLSTHEHQQIPLEDKILILNENQIRLIKQKLSIGNPYGLGLDSFKKRYQDLQFLIENFSDHKLDLSIKDKILHQYRADISTIVPKFMFYVDSYIIADKGKCKNKTLYSNLDLVKHADITVLLNNSNYKPSFEFRETLVDISVDEIHTYSDGTFTPKSLYLSYLRYPKEIDKEGYEKFDGSASLNQDCELEDYLEDELLDLTVESLSMSTENQFAAQSSQARLQTKE